MDEENIRGHDTVTSPDSGTVDTNDEPDLETLIEELTVDDEPSVADENPTSPSGASYAIGRWPEPRDDMLRVLADELGISLRCRECREFGLPRDLVSCAGCGAPKKPAHRYCLRQDPDHRPNAPSGTSDCDEVELKDYIYLTWLLDSSSLEKRKRDLHLDDIWSTWFGVPHDQTDARPNMYIWPRVNNLLNTTKEMPDRQYPSLVSFVGDTGSGKSTLIRAMIRLLAPGSHKHYSAPVPGTLQDQFTSTSSDVHLFADPGTISDEVPVLLADCEGFFGGTTPVSRKIVADANLSYSVSQLLKDGTLRKTPDKPGKSPKELIQDHLSNASRKIRLEWGYTLFPASQLTSPIMSTPMPRQGATQDILWNLFDWAKEGLERTLNQRVRPGLIIVLNKNSEASDKLLHDVDHATNELLRSFEQSSRYTEFRDKWKSRGRTITSARDLIKCYYHDFRVVSIPLHARTPSTAKTVSRQIMTLYGEIRSLSDQIRTRRKSFNMNLDIASFNVYLEQSLRILARDHRSSIDFHPISENDSPLPTRPSEHLSLLLGNLVKQRKLNTTMEIGGEARLIDDITPYLAACIVAPSPRSNLEDEQKRREFLVDEFCRGLEKFRDQSWRCEALDPETGRRRCRNYWESHEKGHQFTTLISRFSEDSPVLQIGQHECSYDPGVFRDHLWEAIIKLGQAQEARIELEKTSQSNGIAKLTSQRTCLSCLANCPTNVLPCMPHQHAICEPCIRRNGQGEPHHSTITITKCPLGCHFTTLHPWTVRVKPERAGPRILVLDGGGIRGIIELQILAKLVQEVGFEIPIQHLFDLVIGTSTGGIVALGVFEKGWSPKHGIRQFERFASMAFTKRRGLKVPLIGKMSEPFCTFKYRTAGIEDALKSAFGNEFLFGQGRSDTNSRGDSAKVGVVSCLEGRNQPSLIANYNRNPRQGGKEEDCLQREDNQSQDFKTWQAARATSAAQTFFKPYQHPQTLKSYVDGATVRNNPVRVAQAEARNIWGSAVPPDIVLSIGTGIKVDRQGKTATHQKKARLEKAKKLLPRRIRKAVDTGLDMVASTLDCQREWEDFLRANQSDARLLRNCHRLDVGLADYGAPPPLDAVDRMYTLSSDAEWYLAPDDRWDAPSNNTGKAYFNPAYAFAHEHAVVVASRLIAALFYFSEDLALLEQQQQPHAVTVKGVDGGGGVITTTTTTTSLRGYIFCRLPPQSNGAVNLIASGPRFRLREGEDRISDVRFLDPRRPFDGKTLAAPVELQLRNGGNGKVERVIEVQLSMRANHGWTPISDDWTPISGF
ncbi:hypothetical protein F4810DRAFT_712454 [Camillea tinctor]|nr:hypothetical protein F4810DRAFT_712454 [Camillea tinctor]